MPPLVRASELKENSPDVDTLLRHKPSNNTSIKIDRLSIKVKPKNITHSTKFPSGLRKVQTPEVRLVEAASTSLVWRVKLQDIYEVQSGVSIFFSAPKTRLRLF
jgi:hypothetical protein